MDEPQSPAPFQRGVRIAIDVGTVRVGVAACDPDGLIASPVVTLQRQKDDSDVESLADLVKERSAIVVYVGLPRHLSGKEGASAEYARAYASKLERHIEPVPVRFVDERLSTVTAQQSLRAAGRSSKRQRDVIDQAAAVVILESALEAERRGIRP